MAEMKNEYNILVGKSERMGSLVSSIHRCQNNIQMHLRETGWESVD
jgi:hypothetical protein